MMRRWMRGIGIGCLLLAQAGGVVSPVPGAPAAPGASPARTPPLEVSGVTLRIRHRVFEKFADERRVRPREVFQIGDTDYSAQIVRFVPDFAMNLKTGKIATRTPLPNNPAFQIIVKEKHVPQDTTWAFLNSPPHFARKSMLAFQILRIEFTNHEPVVRPDSAGVSPASSAARTPAAPQTPAPPAGKK
jgi:hypothetical protein